jgi:hypothetical protein
MLAGIRHDTRLEAELEAQISLSMSGVRASPILRRFLVLSSFYPVDCSASHPNPIHSISTLDGDDHFVVVPCLACADTLASSSFFASLGHFSRPPMLGRQFSLLDPAIPIDNISPLRHASQFLLISTDLCLFHYHAITPLAHLSTHSLPCQELNI